MDRNVKTLPDAGGVRVLTIVSLAVAMTMGFAIPTRAQSLSDVRLLNESDLRGMSKKARTLYEEGRHALDHVNPVRAIRKISQASHLAPEATELQFLTARLAVLRANRVMGSQAEGYYDVAEAALARIGQNKNLTALQKRRYQTMLERVSKEKQRQGTRDENRMATRVDLLQRLEKERLQRRSKTKRLVVKKPIVSSRSRSRRTRGPRPDDMFGRGRGGMGQQGGQSGGSGQMFGGQRGGGFPQGGMPVGGGPGMGPMGGRPPRPF